MKKLGKITLSRKYDVLSENEMKSIIGGSGSGASTENCKGKRGYKCYEGPGYEIFYSHRCAHNEDDAKSGYCEMPGRSANCMQIAVCNLINVWQ